MQAARNRLENQRLVDMMPNANKLQEIDMRNRELDAIVEQKQQEMVIRGGVAGAVAPILPGGAMALDVAARARDEERGGRVAISGLNAIQPGTGNLINSLLDRFTEFRDEQVKTREAIQQINKLPQQRPPQPAVRPKEAPLPAATAP
jgi:hypothetical protein